jgi:hypothetical protein
MRSRTGKIILAIAACFLLFGICSQIGCSIPSLESQQCTETRDIVKEFYSWYLGTDTEMRAKQRDIYERYIASEFQPSSRNDEDPFFLSGTTPTTFKIGKCEVVSDTEVEIQVQLYWRQGNKTDQKEVYAETIKQGDKWVIDKVESR